MSGGGGYGASRYPNGSGNGQDGAHMDMSGQYDSSINNPGGLNELEQVINSINTVPNQLKLKQKVCVHWLKGVCRKGNQCEYLHLYVPEKIPICRFFKERGHCDQQETCVYRHPDKPDDPGASKKQE